MMRDVLVRREAGVDVDALLARMTLAEKVGQMTQLTLEAVSAARKTPTSRWALDPAKLERALVRYHVGSLLNVWDVAFTPAEWHALIETVQRVAVGRTRLGIPVLYGVDAVHGANYTMGGTLFPHNLGLAASWDPGLVRRAGAVTALEVRACGIPWNFSPVLDLGRHPLWSRFFETFGEDVHLATVLGRAAVEGLQGKDVAAADRVAACAKHFVGYGFPISGRDRTPSWIPEPFLREYFLPMFAEAVRAGVRTVMVNSGEVNGVPVHASPWLLTRVLREELGFDGVVVTDWEDVAKLHTVHRVAADEREAVRLAVEAGVDMSMTPLSLTFHDHLVALVEDGVVAEERVDRSVRRILRLKAELGLFEAPVPPDDARCRVGSEASKAVSREAAEASVVLLRNEGVLPLPPGRRVLVTGPAAVDVAFLHGAWSYTWQGADGAAYPAGLPTLLDALRERLGAAALDYVPDASAAAQAAAGADVAIVCLGELPSVEKPGDIDDLRLEAAQFGLLRAVVETGTPVVLVLLQGRPRLLDDLAERCAAVVFAAYPGPFGAEVLAGVLCGDVEPGGRLPFTYPRHPAVLLPYDHKESDRMGRGFGVEAHFAMDGFDPLWRFGHGLSYTTFAYRDLDVEETTLPPDGVLHVSVTVENTGERAGREVVQLYVRDDYATITPPAERLRAFEKVSLAPGESRRVAFAVPVAGLAFVGPNGRRVVEPGTFEARVGPLRRAFAVASPSDGRSA